ncbi:MAG TPA: hypothetical protein VK392_05915 [Thermoanaerobaculia bacterium]|nr:hypothetical protein [Thermoanaerobaculia bacterium]
MGDHDSAGAPTSRELRARLRERLSALKGDLERLRFETDRRWDELLTRLSERPEEIVPEELLREASRPESPGAVSAGAARRIDSATTQVEALTSFIEECRRHASRVALLVERDGRFEIWRSSGFAAGEAKGKSLPADAGGELLEGIPQRLGRGSSVSALLGAADASEAVLVPFVVREKVSGAVYADVVSGNRDRLDADAVALLTWIAGLAVDRLAVRKLAPSPALRAFRGAEEAAEADVSPSFASIPSVERPAAPLPSDEGIPTLPDAAAPAASDRAEISAPAAATTRERPLGGPLARPVGAEGRGEARRFARLLASEIKLYNEREVAEGRARGDLYARLRADIERGRRLYEERIPADLRSGADYYYEELVEVLAGGRAEALR